MAYANIVSTGSYLPEIEITNDMLRKRFNGSAPELEASILSTNSGALPLKRSRNMSFVTSISGR